MSDTWWKNRPPAEYVLDIADAIALRGGPTSASDAAVRALQTRDARVAVNGFRRAVEEAILDDALRDHYGTRPRYNYARVVKRYGSRRATRYFRERLQPLAVLFAERWLPDAYLVDPQQGVVVCYEVEDTHHLSRTKIRSYGRLWYALDEMYWDLHLISYDVYGNARVYAFPFADVVARVRSGARRLRSIEEVDFR